MTSEVSLVLPGTLMLRGPKEETLSIGLLAPLSGVMGISGPSILNCALLAAEHVSERAGIRIELVTIDAGRGAGEAARLARQLVDSELIQGLVGAHTSDVRAAVSRVIGDRMPYIFTPPHEREHSSHSGTIFIGSDTRLQLEQPLEWIIGHYRVRRWALIGNDYIWPRQVHRTASRVLKGLGQSIVMDRLVPMGSVDAERLLDEAQKNNADAILLSLVGRDGITFQRVATEVGADRRLIRLCTALDENSLMAAGGDTSGLLYSAMPSFIRQDDDRHQNLLGLYLDRFGKSAPLPASYAQGCYDGVVLLAELWLSGFLESMTPSLAVRRMASGAGEERFRFVSSPGGSQLALAEGNDLLVI